MLYAKIENGQVAKWPINERELRALLPNTTFPERITNYDLEGTSYIAVPPASPEEVPQQTADQKIRLTTIAKDENGEWRRVYELEPVTGAAREARLARKWSEVRSRRDALLNDCDWRIARYNREVRMGLTPTDNIAALDQYMQALADLTKQPDPYLIEYPSKP